MKNILFLVGGGLLGYWVATQYGKDNKAAKKDAKDTTPGAAIVDVVATEQKPEIVPASMIQTYDASPNATVSPALTTITPIGAASLDHFDLKYAHDYCR